MNADAIWFRSKEARRDPTIAPKQRGWKRSQDLPETPMEKVVPLIASGLVVKEIASALGLTDSCYKERLRIIKKRAGAKSTPHLVAIAFRMGMIQ